MPLRSGANGLDEGSMATMASERSMAWSRVEASGSVKSCHITGVAYDLLQISRLSLSSMTDGSTSR